MPQLFDNLSIRGITLRNRIGVSPMCMYSYEDGFSNEWQLVHLGARAVGGAGLVIAEATAVEARGRITPYDAGIWSDAHIDALARVAGFLKQHGAVAGIQIAHAGRKASADRPFPPGGGKPFAVGDARAWRVVGPSPTAFDTGYAVPHEMDRDEIKTVQAAFRAGAERALQAGFEWLEIHAAHGYLIHSFYSPLSNQRTDEYGGSFENRIRFLIETLRLVRQVWPERLPLTVRISGSDWAEGGWSVDESVELARCMKNEGVDLVDCSSGGNVAHMGAVVPVGPGYQVPISERIRREAGILTAAVGMITAPAQADEVVRNGRADVVLLGREMLRDAYWALHAAQALKQPVPVPAQYLRAF